jgi:hypothetical protein
MHRSELRALLQEVANGRNPLPTPNASCLDALRASRSRTWGSRASTTTGASATAFPKSFWA